MQDLEVKQQAESKARSSQQQQGSSKPQGAELLEEADAEAAPVKELEEPLMKRLGAFLKQRRDREQAQGKAMFVFVPLS